MKIHNKALPVDATVAATTASFRSIKAALLIGVTTLWILPLRGSLWMDELGTYWVVKDGLRQTLDRAWHVQGQTPLYYVIEWVVRVTAGRSELALRAPSFVAMTIAAYLFYRLARRLMGVETALVATVVFSIGSLIGFSAGDARPYAMATLMVVASTLFLVRWIDSGRVGDGLAYILFAALTVYTHYIFALVLLSHVAYAAARRERVRARGVLLALVGTSALVAPVAPQLLSLLHRSASLSVPAGSAKLLLFEALAPPALVGGAILGVVLSHLLEPIKVRALTADRATLVLGMGWLALTPLTLFGVSAVTPVTIFADRYLVTAAPGFAILGAAALSALARRRARLIVLFAAVACAMLVQGTITHTPENWRGAIGWIDTRSDGPSTPILVHGALIESKQILWLTDPAKASYLNGPTTYYPVTGRSLAMPYLFDDTAQRYLEGLLPILRTSGHFFYVTRYPSVPTPGWMLGRLAVEGFGSPSIRSFGKVKVYEFRRG